MRFLIVEDDAVQSGSLRDLFKAKNHEVLTVKTAEEARALVNAVTFDVVIVDLVLGTTDSITFITWLRNQSNQPSTIVIIVTAILIDTIPNLPLDDKMTVLQKPFDFDQLLSIAEAMYKKAVSAEHPSS